MALTKVSSGLISADAALVDLNIDAGTLYIDATNNRVGVSNQAPTVALEVTGDLVVSASATLGDTQVGQLTFSSLTNTTTDIPEGSKLFFTEQRVLDTAPGGSLSGTLGDVTVQYRTDGNYSGTAQQGSFYFDALNQRLKVYTGSEFIDTIPFTAGGGGGATTEANATFFKYQYTVTSETNNISGADIQEIESGAYVIGKDYEISVPGTTDFTALGAADNNSGTTFTATASGLVSAGDFVATEEYTIVSVDDGAGGATTDFTLIGAADNNIGTTFTATGVGTGTGTASQGSGTAHGILGYSTSSNTDVVVFVNGVKQRESSVDGYQATTGTTIAFTYNLPVDSIVDVQVYELLKNDAYYTKAQTYTQAEVNTQISTALSTYDDQTASDARYVNIDGDTMTGDLNLGDNVKAIFGAGSDLQIYHNGVNNYIDAAGVGHLYLQSQGDDKDVKILSDDGSGGLVEYFRADGSIGEAQLYYYGSEKLHTTTSGIDVTGTVTADGLTVDKEGTDHLKITDTSSSNTLTIGIANTVGIIAVDPTNSVASSDLDFSVDGNKAIRISAGGDISFYEDTGTTAKLFWDSSAESLGIGTDSPNAAFKLDIEGAARTNGSGLYVSPDYSAGNDVYKIYDNSGQFRIESQIFGDANVASSPIVFATSDTDGRVERVRIDSNGRVGIDVIPESWDTPNFPAVLQIGQALALTTSGGDNARLLGNAWYDGTNYRRIVSGYAHQYEQAGGTHRWYLGSGGSAAADSTFTWDEAMRIDSSGRVLVAGTSALTTSTSIQPTFQIIGQDAATGSIYISRDEASTSPAAIYGYKSRNSGAIVLDNDELFALIVEGSDGVGPIRAGTIKFEVDGTPATNNIPTATVFERSDGAAGLTESMRIDSNGDVGIGTNSVSIISTNATTLDLRGRVTTKGGAIRLRSSDNSVSSYFYSDDTSGLAIATETDHSIVFRRNSVDRFRIDNSAIRGLEDVDNRDSYTYDAYLGTTTDVTNAYILVARVDGVDNINGVDGTLVNQTGVRGRFIVSRGANNGFNIEDTIDFVGKRAYSKMHIQEFVTTSTTYAASRLVTLTYNSIDYFAIELGNTSSRQIWFQGIGVKGEGSQYLPHLAQAASVTNVTFNSNVAVIRNNYTNIGTTGANDAQVFYQNTNVSFSNNNGIIFADAGGSGTSSSNLLDDYEEGTWTPGFYDAATGGNQSPTVATGAYTKVGRLVTITIEMVNMSTVGMTGANELYIRDLPFTTGDTAGGSPNYTAPVYARNVTYTGTLQAQLADGSQHIQFGQQASGISAFDGLTVADINSGSSTIEFSLTYFA